MDVESFNEYPTADHAQLVAADFITDAEHNRHNQSQRQQARRQRTLRKIEEQPRHACGSHNTYRQRHKPHVNFRPVDSHYLVIENEREAIR